MAAGTARPGGARSAQAALGFAYDIFSQAAQAIRHPTGVSPLGDLDPAAVIAAGESQSALWLVTYIDGG